MSLASGTLVGGREIGGILAESDIAITYRAHEASLDRTVALAVLRPEVAARAGVVERFRDEARSLGRLIHPSIVAVFDAEVLDGRPMIVMQLVEGTSLEKRVAASELTPGEIVAIVGQIAGALDYAHAQGVAHGGLTLASVVLSSQGRAVVGDFGMASIVGRPVEPDDAALATIARQLLGARAVDVPLAGTATEFANALASALGVTKSTRSVRIEGAGVGRVAVSRRGRRRALVLGGVATAAAALGAIGFALLSRSGSPGSGASANAWTPSAVPPRSLPARGPLLWQAKLDGTQDDLQSVEVTGGGQPNPSLRPSGLPGIPSPPSRQPSGEAEVRLLPGAIELAVTKNGGSLNAIPRLPGLPGSFVSELDLSFDPEAPRANFVWVLRASRQLAGNLRLSCSVDGGVALQVGIPGVGPEVVAGPMPVPGVSSGRVFTIGVSVAGRPVTVFLDGQQLWEVDEPRAPLSNALLLQVGGPVGRVRVVGLRVYAPA